MRVEYRNMSQENQNKNNFSKNEKVEEICEIETSAKTDSEKNSQILSGGSSGVNSKGNLEKNNNSGMRIIKLEGKFRKFLIFKLFFFNFY